MRESKEKRRGGEEPRAVPRVLLRMPLRVLRLMPLRVQLPAAPRTLRAVILTAL